MNQLHGAVTHFNHLHLIICFLRLQPALKLIFSEILDVRMKICHVIQSLIELK